MRLERKKSVSMRWQLAAAVQFCRTCIGRLIERQGYLPLHPKLMFGQCLISLLRPLNYSMLTETGENCQMPLRISEDAPIILIAKMGPSPFAASRSGKISRNCQNKSVARLASFPAGPLG